MIEDNAKKYHLIGIGGAGMSVIAELLQDLGMTISGSDRHESAVLDRLRAAGIVAYGQHDAAQVPADATVVLSSAIRLTNPEREIAEKRQQKIIHRSEALALAARGKRFVAVAGAHGKTTTSAMIAQALLACGEDPSSAIGGAILPHGTGALQGRGNIFVAEADESDGSFLNYRPEVALVTNVEADHLDHYGSLEAFEQAFLEFAACITPGGTLICCGEDGGSARLAERARIEMPHLNVWTYGRPDRSENPTVQLGEFITEPRRSRMTIRKGNLGSHEVNLQVTGDHNLLNAGGAWAVGVALGVAPNDFAEGLATFQGAGRRFEFFGEVQGKRVYNDYAHHPTEVNAALIQAQKVADRGRVIAVFQPHLFSRTQIFADQFAEALSHADEVVLADIFAAREDPMEGVTSALIGDTLRKNGSSVRWAEGATVAEVAVTAASLAKPGDLLMLIGAGDIDQGAVHVTTYWESV